MRTVVSTWWPLAASWLMMGLEWPLVTSVVARLPDERVNLAALGSLVFPLCMLIEAPIIMLLSASTALSKDRASYRSLGRFMWLAGGSLTALHGLVAFTPLFDHVARAVFDAEPQLLGPGRVAMQLMLPWTMAIAFRRHQQGVLIRCGKSRLVGVGTLVRLSSCAVVAFGGLWSSSPWTGALDGAVVGAAAIATGVTAEALFAGFVVRPVVRTHLAPRDANAADTPWSWREFGRFYTPLALLSLVGMAAQPLAAAAIGRMPREVASLAAWPAVNNLVFILRSLAFAANEVVVATITRPGARAVLARFTTGLGLATAALLALVALTPLAALWLGGVQDLDPELVELGAFGLLVAIPFPFLQARTSLSTGTLVAARRTRGVGEAVGVFLGTTALLLALGAAFVPWPGVHQAPLALTLGALAQMLWLERRTRALHSTHAAHRDAPGAQRG
jgi:uncharacterized membrane protein